MSYNNLMGWFVSASDSVLVGFFGVKTRLRVPLLFDCKILKTEYGERRGNNDEALTWGRGLINLIFSKDVYRHSLFFFLARSPIFFEKNEKKYKTKSVYRLVLKWTAKAFLHCYAVVHSLFCIDYECTNAVNLLTSCRIHAFARFVLQSVELRLSNSLFREDN